MAEGEAVVVEHEDRGVEAAGGGLDEVTDAGEDVGGRLAAGDHLEQALLAGDEGLGVFAVVDVWVRAGHFTTSPGARRAL